MTDDTSDTETARTDASRERPDPPRDDAGDAADDTAARLRRYLNYALLAGLVLLAFVAALQFYLNATAAINQWVAPEYRSVFQAVFNLAVLLVAAAGLVRQVDRISTAVSD